MNNVWIVQRIWTVDMVDKLSIEEIFSSFEKAQAWVSKKEEEFPDAFYVLEEWNVT